MEWANGGKEEKNPWAVCCILVTHQGLETKTSPPAPSSAPPHPSKLSLLTGREGDRVFQPSDRGREGCQTVHMLLFVSIFPCVCRHLTCLRNNSNIIMLLHGLSAEFSLFTLLVVPPWAAPPSGSSSSHENTNITCGLIFITVWILLQPGGHSRPAELSSQQPVSYLCFRTLIPPRFATSNPAPLQRHFPKFKWGHGVKKKKAHFSSLSIPKVSQQVGGPNSHAPNWEFVRPKLKWAEHGTRPLMHKQLKYYLSNPSTLNVTYLVFYQNNVSRSNHTDFPNNVKHSKLALHRQ